MLSAFSIKAQFYAVLRLLLHAGGGGYIEFTYNKRILRLQIQDTGKIDHEKYKRISKRKLEIATKIETSVCEDCGGVMINEVCMGTKHGNYVGS